MIIKSSHVDHLRTRFTYQIDNAITIGVSPPGTAATERSDVVRSDPINILEVKPKGLP